MNVLSLFDGISCGQIALGRVGLKVDNYLASEIDKYAIQVTQANYPDTVQLGSITEWRNWNIENPDIIIGGSPCQGFSFAGKQLNFEDERSKLFFVFADILKHYKPKYFLLENVIMKAEYNDVISGILGEIYPECVHQTELFRTGRLEPIEINSALVSAQNRRRLYWTNIPGVTQPKDKGILLKDIIENYDGKSEIISATIGNSKKFYGENNSGKSYCLIKNHCFGIKLNDEYRLFSPIECERLQTVPDNYTNHVSNSQRYKMLGNGWTVDVIAHIFSFIPESTK
jgi:site-specific DNA-cytosine methylase